MGMCFSNDKEETPPPQEETGFKSNYVKARVKERSEAREREALLRQQQQQQMQSQTMTSSQGNYQGGGSITRLQGQTSGLASDMARARQGLDERGQRLRQVEDVTIRMGSESQNLGKTTGKLKSKYQ